MGSQIQCILGPMLSVAASLAINSRALLFTALIYLGDALLCYECDILSDPACNQYFMAYQFRPTQCPTKPNGDLPWCGKQQQPPLANGWVGVIRSCYYPGDLPDMNETIGCHHHVMTDTNFSAVYCLCKRDLCNDAISTLTLPPPFSLRKHNKSCLSFYAHALSQLVTSALACPIFLTTRVLLDFFLINLPDF